MPITKTVPTPDWEVERVESSFISGSTDPPTIAAIQSAITYFVRSMTGAGKSSNFVVAANSAT